MYYKNDEILTLHHIVMGTYAIISQSLVSLLLYYLEKNSK